MVDTPAQKLAQAVKRQQDIQKAIRDHAAELGKTVGAQRQEEGQANDGANSG